MNPSEIPLSERVYEAIREIERRKTEARIVPSHALMIRDIFPETGYRLRRYFPSVSNCISRGEQQVAQLSMIDTLKHYSIYET